ncbi:hypothetical protein JNO12_16865 [Erwinia aphidicola]|nr:hypothetical protein [Erwinia aphidicola]
MATIIWKSAAPSGTCRSRYKARRAAAVAQRRRDKLLLRKISQLLDPQARMGIGGGDASGFFCGARLPAVRSAAPAGVAILFILSAASRR